MKVGDLSIEHLAARLARGGVAIRWGPFVSRIVSRLPELPAPIRLLYADFPIEPPGGICDFNVSIRARRSPRPWSEAQVEFVLHGEPIFTPFPRPFAPALLEWGLNWCVYSSAHQFLIIHAAVVERGGHALLLPGQTGAGKSTLCAALVSAGWRLFSDELALIDPADGSVRPIARPISLKNASIDLIRGVAPDAAFGPCAIATHKGTVAHMRPPAESVRRADEPGWPRWIVMPQFAQGEALHLAPLPKARAFFNLAETSMNYEVLGDTGFRLMVRLIDDSDCYKLTLSSLDEAVAAMDQLSHRTLSSKRRAAVNA
jgi:HprK-related kinase A